jgi:CheY-like chemotaxis protein
MLESIGSGEAGTRDLKPANEIFVVDDNEDYRELLAGILELEGFEVSAFPEGTSFLRQASSKVPVCVFLDIVMPGPSGLDVLKKLNERNYAAPIFLISARNDSAAVVEGMKYGAQAIAPKRLQSRMPCHCDCIAVSGYPAWSGTCSSTSFPATTTWRSANCWVSASRVSRPTVGA